MNVEQTPSSETAGDVILVTTVGVGNCFFVKGGSGQLLMRIMGSTPIEAGYVKAVEVRTGMIVHVPQTFDVHRAQTLCMVAGGD